MAYGSMIRRATARGRGGMGMQPSGMGMQPQRGGGGGLGQLRNAMARMRQPGQQQMGPNPNAMQAPAMRGAGGYQQLAEPMPVKTPELPQAPPPMGMKDMAMQQGGGGNINPFMGPQMPKRTMSPYMMGGGFTGRGGGGGLY
jgi:hypothetical protein